MPSRIVQILRFIAVLFGVSLCLGGTGMCISPGRGSDFLFGLISLGIGLSINYWFFVYLPKKDSENIRNGK